MTRRQPITHSKPPTLAYVHEGCQEPADRFLAEPSTCKRAVASLSMTPSSLCPRSRHGSRARAQLATCGEATADDIMRSVQREIWGQLVSRRSSAITSRPETRRACPDHRTCVLCLAVCTPNVVCSQVGAVLTLAQCWHTLFQQRSSEVLERTF